jgi:hypothetical protein
MISALLPLAEIAVTVPNIVLSNKLMKSGTLALTACVRLMAIMLPYLIEDFSRSAASVNGAANGVETRALFRKVHQAMVRVLPTINHVIARHAAKSHALCMPLCTAIASYIAVVLASVVAHVHVAELYSPNLPTGSTSSTSSNSSSHKVDSKYVCKQAKAALVNQFIKPLSYLLDSMCVIGAPNVDKHRTHLSADNLLGIWLKIRFWSFVLPAISTSTHSHMPVLATGNTLAKADVHTQVSMTIDPEFAFLVFECTSTNTASTSTTSNDMEFNTNGNRIGLSTYSELYAIWAIGSIAKKTEPAIALESGLDTLEECLLLFARARSHYVASNADAVPIATDMTFISDAFFRSLQVSQTRNSGICTGTSIGASAGAGAGAGANGKVNEMEKEKTIPSAVLAFVNALCAWNFANFTPRPIVEAVGAVIHPYIVRLVRHLGMRAFKASDSEIPLLSQAMSELKVLSIRGLFPKMKQHSVFSTEIYREFIERDVQAACKQALEYFKATPKNTLV